MYGSHRYQDFLWGALVGGAVGTLTALLFTTRKGKQLQRQIVDTYEELEDSVKSTASEAKQKVGEAAENGGKKVANKLKKDDEII